MSRHIANFSQFGSLEIPQFDSWEILSPVRKGLAKNMEIIGWSAPFLISNPQEIGEPCLSILRYICAFDGRRRAFKSSGVGSAALVLTDAKMKMRTTELYGQIAIEE